MGKRATKMVLKTPVTTPSHVTRTPGRMLARRRLSVAVRAEERVETECDVRVRKAVRIRDRGMVAMRESVKSGRIA